MIADVVKISLIFQLFLRTAFSALNKPVSIKRFVSQVKYEGSHQFDENTNYLVKHFSQIDICIIQKLLE